MKFTLNLASRRYANNRALKYAYIAALCLLALYGVWELNSLVSSYSSLQQSNLRLLEVEQQHQALTGGPVKTLSAAERTQLENEFDVARELLVQDAFRWTELLDRMEKLLPKGVSLGGFRPDFKKRSLALSGRARDLKAMRVFLDRLLKNDSFKKVYLKNHSRIKVRDYADMERDAITFSIQLEGVF
jgi:Tfp pilus assembly protein PilN